MLLGCWGAGEKISMALINVVKSDIIDGEFCCKFPSEDLKLGSKLVVYPSQTAFFVKGGVILDAFTSGTYTITSENIPLLNKVINIPFGNESPFKAEVWFVNQISKLDMPWGTPHPILIEDPKYRIIVPVRSNGQYGLKIKDPRLFFETLIGNMSSFTADKIKQYFKGRLVQALNSLLANQIIERNVSVLDINTDLIPMSAECEAQLNEIFGKYGIEIKEFSIMSVNVPENDDSVIKLKEAKAMMARLNITGKDVYQMERSFDILEKAAGNEGAGGQMIGMGVGLGAGVTAGSKMAQMSSQMINTNPTPPPLNMDKQYFIHIEGSQIGGQTTNSILALIQQGRANGETPVWTAGMSNWVRLKDVPELSVLLNNSVPPPMNL